MQQSASFTETPIGLMKAAKKAGCMAFKLGNRVDYLEFVKWYWANNAKSNDEVPDGFASWKEVLESEKAKREAIKRQQDEGRLMSTADAVAQAGAAMGTVFAELERRDRELPPVLAGLEPVEIFKRMMAETERIRAAIKAKFDEVGS